MRNPERVAYVWAISTGLRCAGLEFRVQSKSFLCRESEEDDEDEEDTNMRVQFGDVLDIHLEWKRKKKTERRKQRRKDVILEESMRENSMQLLLLVVEVF